MKRRTNRRAPQPPVGGTRKSELTWTFDEALDSLTASEQGGLGLGGGMSDKQMVHDIIDQVIQARSTWPTKIVLHLSNGQQMSLGRTEVVHVVGGPKPAFMVKAGDAFIGENPYGLGDFPGDKAYKAVTVLVVREVPA